MVGPLGIVYRRLMIKGVPATSGPHNRVALSLNGAVYVDASGELQVDVRLDMEGETVWLTQVQLADLFSVDVRTVNEHLANIYRAGELEREATIRKFRMVRQEGQRQVERDISHYNLDAVISVGYRVNSKTATAFRQWATRALKARLIDEHRRRQGVQSR